MDKEKLLEQVREEGNDEGEQHAHYRGLSIGYKIFEALMVFLLAFEGVLRRSPDTSRSAAVFMLMFAFNAAKSYARYEFSKKRKDLLFCIFEALAGAYFLIVYLTNWWIHRHV